MTILIIALVAVLVSLSRKYILRLEPAGVFAAMWAFMVIAIMILQEFFELRFYGILFIIGCIITFVLGTIFCDTTYNPQPSQKVLSFRKEWALPIMLLLLVGAMVNPLYSIILHGFSLKALLSMQDILYMNKGISEIRYAGSEAYDIVNQIFLIFCYTAPLFGGFCFRWGGKLTKAICILTLIPGMVIALTQSMKMVMITGFILWFSGYILCCYSYDIPIRIKAKHLIKITTALIGFFGNLIYLYGFQNG